MYDSTRTDKPLYSRIVVPTSTLIVSFQGKVCSRCINVSLIVNGSLTSGRQTLHGIDFELYIDFILDDYVGIDKLFWQAKIGMSLVIVNVYILHINTLICRSVFRVLNINLEGDV